MPDDDKQIPEWALIVWRMKAELDAMEYRIAKLEAQWQSRK